MIKQFFKNDKVKHVLAMVFLACTGLIITPNGIIAGFIAGVFWGGFKELTDMKGLFFQKRTGWNWGDFIVTVIAGVVVGVILEYTGLAEYLKTTETLF